MILKYGEVAVDKKYLSALEGLYKAFSESELDSKSLRKIERAFRKVFMREIDLSRAKLASQKNLASSPPRR